MRLIRLKRADSLFTVPYDMPKAFLIRSKKRSSIVQSPLDGVFPAGMRPVGPEEKTYTEKASEGVCLGSLTLRGPQTEKPFPAKNKFFDGVNNAFGVSIA